MQVIQIKRETVYLHLWVFLSRHQYWALYFLVPEAFLLSLETGTTSILPWGHVNALLFKGTSTEAANVPPSIFWQLDGHVGSSPSGDVQNSLSLATSSSSFEGIPRLSQARLETVLQACPRIPWKPHQGGIQEVSNQITGHPICQFLMSASPKCGSGVNNLKWQHTRVFHRWRQLSRVC